MVLLAIVFFGLIVLGVIAVVMYVISTQRELVKLDEMGNNALSQIGVQLQSRFDAITALVKMTQQYAQHEYEALTQVIAQRRVSEIKTVDDVNQQTDLLGSVMGRLMARELQMSNFFEGIDAIIPVPLAKKRERQRGYNQSHELAKGISEITRLPIYNKVVRRTVFEGSQTSLGRWERNENVEQVFKLKDTTTIQGKHLLIVDDVVTTGATVIACAKELCKAGDVRISVLSLGLAKN